MHLLKDKFGDTLKHKNFNINKLLAEIAEIGYDRPTNVPTSKKATSAKASMKTNMKTSTEQVNEPSLQELVAKAVKEYLTKEHLFENDSIENNPIENGSLVREDNIGNWDAVSIESQGSSVEIKHYIPIIISDNAFPKMLTKEVVFQPVKSKYAIKTIDNSFKFKGSKFLFIKDDSIPPKLGDTRIYEVWREPMNNGNPDEEGKFYVGENGQLYRHDIKTQMLEAARSSNGLLYWEKLLDHVFKKSPYTFTVPVDNYELDHLNCEDKFVSCEGQEETEYCENLQYFDKIKFYRDADGELYKFIIKDNPMVRYVANDKKLYEFDGNNHLIPSIFQEREQVWKKKIVKPAKNNIAEMSEKMCGKMQAE